MASHIYTPAVAPDGDLPFKLIGGFAASCFVGAFVADVVYALSPDFKWVTFSVWLITIGLFVALLATLVGIVDRARQGRLGSVFAYWPYLLGFAAAIIVAIFNAFIHSRDAYEAVVPSGIVLSASTVAILGLTPVFALAVIRNRTRKVTP